MVKKNASLIGALFFLAIVALVMSVTLINWQDGTITSAQFEKLEFNLNTYDLFDFGVVKANSDEFLDIYTVNHSAQQSMLIGDGQGKFVDALTEMNLDQDHEVAQLEDSNLAPQMVKPGLYIYRKNRWLTLHAFQTSDLGVMNGRITIPWPVEVMVEGKAEYTKKSIPQSQTNAVMTEVEFVIHDSGSLILNGADNIPELPHGFSLDSNISLDHVYLGMKNSSPTKHGFTLMWRDRHSMSWADYNGDNNMDVFAGRGGVKGLLDRVPAVIRDELFLGNGVAFEDHIAQSGMEKGICPVRQSAWVDFDGDGDLDLYVSCGREQVLAHYPNQLFQQDEDGEFTEVANKFGLDTPYISVFRWLDIDTDNDMDLLSIENESINLYRNQKGHFEKTELAPDLASNYLKIAVADYDNDGDLDAYAVSREASLLLMNTQGDMTVVDPSSVGLPVGGRTANWTDYNNDGLVDLHVVPGGLFRQLTNHTFEETSILRERTPAQRVSSARCEWFDMDRNGTRDALCAVEKYPVKLIRIAKKLFDRDKDTRYWRTNLYKNKDSENHWLQVDLIGPPENRQAIGARVYIVTDENEQMQQVGTTEGSHSSQGHYRLYFGLGQSQSPQAMTVVWPDGRIQEISGLKGDRLMVVDGG